MFTGRIDRKGFVIGYLFAYLPVIVFTLGIVFLNYVVHTPFNSKSLFPVTIPTMLVFGIYLITFYYPVIIGLSLRRWHDMGQPGWWSFLQLWSTIGLLVAIFQMVYPGENEQNEYGQPESPRRLRDILFGARSINTQSATVPPSQQQTGIQPPENPSANPHI